MVLPLPVRQPPGRKHQREGGGHATPAPPLRLLLLAAGGTQVSNDYAREAGMDQGFGRGSKGVHVATFLVKKRRELDNEG